MIYLNMIIVAVLMLPMHNLYGKHKNGGLCEGRVDVKSYLDHGQQSKCQLLNTAKGYKGKKKGKRAGACLRSYQTYNIIEARNYVPCRMYKEKCIAYSACTCSDTECTKG